MSKLAGERVKVVLSADGGDELFRGYNIYANMIGNVQRREAIPLPCAAWSATGMRCFQSTAVDETARGELVLPDSWRGRQRPTFRLRRMRDWLGSRDKRTDVSDGARQQLVGR